MRNILISLVLVGVFGLAQSARAQADDAIAKRVERLLSVHVEVENQTYCHIDDEAFMAKIGLKLQFVNFSDHEVILSRMIEPPPVVRVARDVQAGEDGVFLAAPEGHFAVAELPKGPKLGDAPDEKLFVRLAPGERFETQSSTTVAGANDPQSAKKGNGLLAKGSYVLQVGIYTWPYEWPFFNVQSSAQQVKERWAKYGELATGMVYSDFAAFALPEHFKNPPCPMPRAKSRPSNPR